MGLACPVCAEPAADAEHLANHLAIVALTRGGEHEAWLDETAPEWENRSPEELGERIAEYAPETDHEFEAEPTEPAPDRPDVRFEDALGRQSAAPGRGALGDEAAEVLTEARELTAQMYGDEQSDDDQSDGAVSLDDDPSDGDAQPDDDR